MYVYGYGSFSYISYGVAVDPDAQAFITAASITDPTQQSAVNQLVLDLKSASIWTKMKAVYPFVGGSAASHKWNLKDPRDLDAAFRLSFAGGWTHNADGITGNGSNTFVNTFLRGNQLQRDSAHASVYVGTDSTGNYLELGTYQPTVWASLYAKLSGNFSARINTSGTSVDVANSDARGFYQVNRPDSSTVKTLKSAGSINSSSIASVDNSGVTNPYYIGGINFNGGPLGYYTNRRMSFVSFGDGLSDTDMANFYTAVQTFQTTLSRNV